MKAYELQEAIGLRGIRLVERPDPVVSDQAVVIRVDAVSLNYSDLTAARGGYRKNVPLPMIPCSDGAGEIVAAGSGVSRFRVGQRVAAAFMPRRIHGGIRDEMTRVATGRTIDGMLAEYVVRDEESIVAIPDYLSAEEASTLPTAALTAWHALHPVDSLQLTAAQKILIQGTGGVSVFALQFAAALGLEAIALSGSDAKRARLASLGAASTVNYRTTPEWDAEIYALTSKQGVDHAVDVVGASSLSKTMRAVRTGGSISMVGTLGGQNEVNPVPIIMKSLRVFGIYVGSREMFESMNRFLAQHRIRPVVDSTFSFSEALAALERLQSGEHFGKIVIRLR